MDAFEKTDLQASARMPGAFPIPACWILFTLSMASIGAFVGIFFWVANVVGTPSMFGWLLLIPFAPLLVLSWGFAVSSLATAIVRLANTEPDAQGKIPKPRTVSAAICLAASLIMVASPLLMHVVMFPPTWL